VISILGYTEAFSAGSFVTPDKDAVAGPTAPSDFTYFKFVSMFYEYY